MEKIEKMKAYAEETVEIIKDLIDKELIKAELISLVRASENGDTVILKDLFNKEVHYSLSEVSYIFSDYLDCLGEIDKNAYQTVLFSKRNEQCEKNKHLFIKSLCRLKTIERNV